jgi:hypothetical protein
MKLSLITLAVLICALPVWAVTPSELVKGIDDQLLTGYVKPLVNGFGMGINTGTFHTAKAHKLLGLDFSLNVMVFTIPEADRHFGDSVRCCSLNTQTGALDTFRRYAPNLPTIFGPAGIDSLQKSLDLPPNAVAIPPVWPGGLNLPATFFLMPQLNVGLVAGLEVMLRGLPWTYRGDNFSFYGAGLKWEPTVLPALNMIPLNLAAQIGFHQFHLGDAISSTSWNFNAEVSKDLWLLTLYGGAGYENTAVNVNYRFDFKLPTIDSTGFRMEDVSKDISFTTTAQNHFRCLVGLTVHPVPLAMIYVDYNVAGRYQGINAGVGISFR